MKKRSFCLLLLATFYGISGCSTTPKVTPYSNEDLIGNYRYSTDLLWTTVNQANGKTASAALALAGFDPAWIKTLPPDHAKTLENRFEGRDFEVIHDDRGVVHELYGRDKEDKFVRVKCLESCELIEAEGFAAKTKNMVFVSSDTATDRLDNIQQLAIKRLMYRLSKKTQPGLYEKALQAGELDLFFDALFMNGELVGPTTIIEAKVKPKH